MGEVCYGPCFLKTLVYYLKPFKVLAVIVRNQVFPCLSAREVKAFLLKNVQLLGYLFTVCVHACSPVCMCMSCVRRSEDGFYHARDETQAVRVGNSHLYPLGRLAGPAVLLSSLFWIMLVVELWSHSREQQILQMTWAT